MEKLNVWLIKEGETLPIVENARLMRTGSLAKYLAEHGHEVTWWTSTFIHGEKKYLYRHYREIEVVRNEHLIFLHSKIAYKKNISISRILYEYILSKQFALKCRNFVKPDIIICSWPLPSFAREAVKYGKKYNVPVVIDIRDEWPDIFIRLFPKKIEELGQLILFPLKVSAKAVLKQATGITAIMPQTLEWGCHYAGRSPGVYDKSIHIGNDKVTITPKEIKLMKSWWETLGVSEKNWNLCFFGTLSATNSDLETVIKAVLELSKKYDDLWLVICGKGDGRHKLESIAGDSKQIIFADWVNNVQMNSLMLMSKCGVYSPENSNDFKDTFGNKAIQYLSGGMPILNSLQGFAKKFLEESCAGLTYIEGNVSDCTDKIERLYKDDKMQKDMSRNALKQFEAFFDSNIVNKDFEDYIYKITGRNNDGFY